jgi:hypothetical protein
MKFQGGAIVTQAAIGKFDNGYNCIILVLKLL